LDHNGIITALQNMSDSPVSFVKGNSEAAVESFHPSCQIGFRGFEEQVILIRQETVPVAEPSVLLDGLSQELQEPRMVFIIVVDGLLVVSPGDDVIHCARELGPERAGHIDTPFLSVQ
jgi:hypothetical protein